MQLLCLQKILSLQHNKKRRIFKKLFNQTLQKVSTVGIALYYKFRVDFFFIVRKIAENFLVIGELNLIQKLNKNYLSNVSY